MNAMIEFGGHSVAVCRGRSRAGFRVVDDRFLVGFSGCSVRMTG